MTETEEVFTIEGKMGFYLTHCIIPTLQQELAIREIINRGYIPVVVLTNLDQEAKSGYTFEERYEMISRLLSFYCDRYLVMAINGYPDSYSELEVFEKILQGALGQHNLKMIVHQAVIFTEMKSGRPWWKPLASKYPVSYFTYHDALALNMSEEDVLSDIVENQHYIHPVVMAELVKVTRTRPAKETIN